jgi:PqqA peptide cyclase
MTTPRPYTLIAELTYRCPLHCPYCSNPPRRTSETLPVEVWERTLEHAAALGVVQLHLTGGEPLLYRDLERLVARGRQLDMYVNLVTSGVPLTHTRLEALQAAGLDHIQLSIQDASQQASDAIAGARVFERKLEAAAWIRVSGLAFTLNVVLHRANIDHVAQIVALAEELGAHRLELANTQYLGVALANRGWLLPTREQIDAAFEVAAYERDRLFGRMEIVFVKPDYFGTTPRACMDGWARTYIHVTPAGMVLPCHAAEAIPGLVFDNVRDGSLADIWASSPALARFRGDTWMKDPCRSCDRRAIDFGGCRCQAYLLTGDATAADPACALSPAHGVIESVHNERTYVLRLRR